MHFLGLAKNIPRKGGSREDHFHLIDEKVRSQELHLPPGLLLGGLLCLVTPVESSKFGCFDTLALHVPLVLAFPISVFH